MKEPRLSQAVQSQNSSIIDSIDKRLGRIEDKLDSYGDKINKAETDLTWIKSYIKLIIGSAILPVVITAVLTYIK